MHIFLYVCTSFLEKYDHLQSRTGASLVSDHLAVRHVRGGFWHTPSPSAPSRLFQRVPARAFRPGKQHPPRHFPLVEPLSVYGNANTRRPAIRRFLPPAMVFRHFRGIHLHQLCLRLHPARLYCRLWLLYPDFPIHETSLGLLHHGCDIHNVGVFRGQCSAPLLDYRRCLAALGIVGLFLVV